MIIRAWNCQKIPSFLLLHDYRHKVPCRIYKYNPAEAFIAPGIQQDLPKVPPTDGWSKPAGDG